MQAKQYYASLELADDELRLIIGEFYMSRFNPLKVERVKTDGIQKKRIVNPTVVAASIVTMLDAVEKSLGFRLKSIILCIPSADVKCIKRRVNVPIEEGSRRIRTSHARLGIEKAIDSFQIDGYEFVNIGSITYINGGIASRTLPVDERSETLTMDIDFICAKQEVVHEFVLCVENAGLRVADICLDTYAIAEEAAIIEGSMDKYVVLTNFEKYDTDLALFYKGRFMGCESLGFGYERLAQVIRRKFRLTEKEATDLLKESAIFPTYERDDSIIYIYSEKEEYREITRKEIYSAIEEELQHWIVGVNEANEMIAQTGQARMVLAGSGADILGMESIKDRFILDCSVYIPSTIGTRRSCYSAVLGAIYTHKKLQALVHMQSEGVEISTESVRQLQKEDDNAFTKKLKKILLNK
ncbi:cell division protein FtsA [Breznakia blatticola]|uniref:Cell division protein FtsA n=1 Tax=Breznakia blatticola TaxID=1754012 RepID=A0A4R7ZG78_9FIRM|nr:hypothetical protein [Breznakia blatticola]TDW16639.1 cell division protein FtsA [Breznakia blatticola]